MPDDLRCISVVLFEGLERLDVFGPVDLFSMVPDRIGSSPKRTKVQAALGVG
jgi:hypothetical protein